MKANEILWVNVNDYYFSAKERAGQYKWYMKLGGVFPTTKAQAKYFIEEHIELEVLNNKDVERIESMLNKYGYQGEYKFTRSKEWVRLVNYNDLYSSLKSEYLLNNKKYKN